MLQHRLWNRIWALAIGALLISGPAFATKDVVVAVGSNFTTLDPYDANDTLSQAVAKSFYQGLFGLDKGMKVRPVLAESYTVSADGRIYTIKLHRGVKFQDGTDFGRIRKQFRTFLNRQPQHATCAGNPLENQLCLIARNGTTARCRRPASIRLSS